MDFKKKRWIFITLCAISYSAVWTFPYMIETYYIPVQKAFGFSNGQIGMLMTLYGIASALLYGPGGFIADRFSLKKLLAISFVGTGALGAITLLIPPLPVMLVVQFGYGITTILTLWGAIIKFLRMVGDDDEQGKMYGFFFAISGVAGAIMGFGGTAIYDSLGQDVYAFKMLVMFYVICVALPGLIFALTFNEKEAFSTTVDDSNKIKLSQVKDIIKMPIVWLMTGIVFCSFISKSGMTYFQPYLGEYFAVPVATISLIAILRVQVVRLLVTPVAGIITDKTRSSSTTVKYGFILGIAAAALVLVTPHSPQLAWVVIIALFLTATLYNIGIASYYIPISEAKIPVKYTGTITGIVSIVGFSSDIYYYNICGSVIDKFAAQGYTIIFATSLVFCVIGFFLSIMLKKHVEKLSQQAA